MLELYLVKVFLLKKICCLKQFFNEKEELSLVCGGVFVYAGQLGVIYDSQATNRSAAGGGGDSLRKSSLSPIGYLGVIYDSQPHGYALFNSHPD